jgi:hypothetical protein
MSANSRDEIDFADALEVLVTEAHQSGATQGGLGQLPPVAAPSAIAPPAREALDFAKTIRPLVLAVDAMVRAGAENSKRLARVEESAKFLPELPSLLKEVRDLMDSRGGVTRALFDALHDELNSYKENFLLDLLLKPVVRDLVVLYDDLTVQHADLMVFLAGIASEDGEGGGCCERLKIVAQNIDHSTHTILETMARVAVELVPTGKGKLDRTMQKAVSVEVTENPAEDGDVVRSIRPGFRWRDRLFRPEEVVVKKYKEGYLVAFGDAESNKT